MAKRLLEATASDFHAMDGADLADSIRQAEGRAVLTPMNWTQG
jgi:hypothetical protein